MAWFSKLQAYESPCSHVNIVLGTNSPQVWNAALIAPWVHRHAGVVLGWISRSTDACWIISALCAGLHLAGDKDVGQGGRADAELMRWRVVLYIMVGGQFS